MNLISRLSYVQCKTKYKGPVMQLIICTDQYSSLFDTLDHTETHLMYMQVFQRASLLNDTYFTSQCK